MSIYNMTFDTVQDTVQSPPNVIYINASPSASDLLDVVLDCLADAGTNIVLEQQSSQTASPSNYHFSLFFNPGQLALPGAISPSPASSGAWSTAVADHPSGTTIYCLSLDTLTLQPGDSCKLTLQSVGAQPLKGPRGTAINVAFNQNVANVQPHGLSHLPFHVDIENVPKQGGASPSAPLSVGFDTTNMVLSDGSSKNALVLRIVNLSTSDIQVDSAQGGITLLFDADADTTKRWAVATPDQVNEFYVPGELNSSGVDPSWPGYNSWDIQQVTGGWNLTPKDGNTVLAAGAANALEIPISNIVTGHPVGRALLRVQYQGLTGYNDGESTVEVQKTPLLYTNGRVGVGTTTPAVPLQVYTATAQRGISHTDGTVDLATYVSGTGGWLGTFSNHPLNFYTNNSMAQLTLTTDGNLGIGTNSPGAKLDVQGDVNISGKLDVKADVSTSGSAFVAGKLGVGTTSPHDPLQVYTGSGQTGLSHTNGNVDFITYIDDDKGCLLGTWSNHPLHLRTANKAPQVTLTTDGNLGIGTTSPASRLHVSGDLRVDGGVNVNGHKPMELRYFDLGQNSSFDTGYATSDWIACVVGFKNYNPNRGSAPAYRDVYATNMNGSTWHVTVDLGWLTGDDFHAKAMVLFIRREVVGQVDDIDNNS